MVFSLWLAASCGTVPDPAAIDAAVPDAPISDANADAAPDAPPMAGADRIDVMSASGRAQGGGFTLEFQLGHSPAHGAHSGGGVQLETAAPVVP